MSTEDLCLMTNVDDEQNEELPTMRTACAPGGQQSMCKEGWEPHHAQRSRPAGSQEPREEQSRPLAPQVAEPLIHSYKSSSAPEVPVLDGKGPTVALNNNDRVALRGCICWSHWVRGSGRGCQS